MLCLAQEVLEHGFALLLNGWAELTKSNPAVGQKMIPLFESPDCFSRILGMFELNNHDVEIDHPFQAFLLQRLQAGAASEREVAAVQNLMIEKTAVMDAFWNEDATGEFDIPSDEEEAEEDMDSLAGSEMMDGPDETGMQCETTGHGNAACPEESLGQILADSRAKASTKSFDELSRHWPSFHANGFFPSVSKLNHSCRQNAKIYFDEGSNQVQCRAIRPIAAGEEIRICYVREEASFSKRQKLLKEYGFTCSCPRCVEESTLQARPSGA